MGLWVIISEGWYYSREDELKSDLGYLELVWNSPVASNWRELSLLFAGVLFSIGASALIECIRPVTEARS